MFRSLRLGSLAGIDIYVHWTFLLLLGFFLLSGLAAGQGAVAALLNVAFVVTLFGCVVLHELGHALAARRYGIPTRDITLLPIGGVARLERMPRQPLQELVVALAGPAVNVAIAAVLAALLWPAGGWQGLLTGGSFLHKLLQVNVMLVAFNLLPAFPMDGGRVLRSLLALRMDYVRATDIAAGVGQAMAVLFGLLGLLVLGNPLLVLVGVFIFLGAGAEARQARLQPLDAQSQPLPATVADVMIRRVRTLPGYLRVDQVPEDYLRGGQRDFPVIEDQRLVGLLRREDLLGSLASGYRRVGELATRQFPIAEMTEPVNGALARLADSGLATMPVLHHGRLVGLVQLRDADPRRWEETGRGRPRTEETVEAV